MSDAINAIQSAIHPGKYSIQPAEASMGETNFQRQLSLVRSDDQRLRLEVSPIWWRLDSGEWVKILQKGGIILADPNGSKPDRPPGHTWEDHINPTWRWGNLNKGGESEEQEVANQAFSDRILLEVTGALSEQANNWIPIYHDGHSTYYFAQHNSLLRRQVTDKGREMMGKIFMQRWVIQGQEVDLGIQFRLVSSEGFPNTHSPLGTTQITFAGIFPVTA